MKKIFLALTVLAIGFTACKKSDNNNSSSVTTTAVNSTVTSGTWRVTFFSNNGTNETSNYGGFNFTFVANGTVAAANSLFAVNGTWSTLVDNSKVKLTMNFPTPTVNAFLELNQDWEVTARTDIKITMQHVSGGAGGTDYLTIEKN